MNIVGCVGKLSNAGLGFLLVLRLPFRIVFNKDSFKYNSSIFTKAMQQNNKDEYTNPYPDFDGNNGNGILDVAEGKLDDSLMEKIKRAATEFTEVVNTEGDRTTDYSVYTGLAGNALLNLLISQRFSDRKALLKAEEQLRRAPLKIHRSRITFLQDSGPVAISAVISHYLGKATDSKRCLTRLMSVLDDVIGSNPEIPDECLYGRAGYLYSLLFVRKHLGAQAIESSAIKKVVNAIIKSGVSRSAWSKSKVPLVYEWYGENYYGAAHGVAGILYMLFKSGEVTPDDKEKLIKPTLDDLIAQRLASGNFPSSQGSRSDKLVQWCHGAPGFAEVLATAYKEFEDERYLTVALECGDIVWQRGLCTKGYSICHGVSGNAYTFLQLYQLTGDLKHLYRAGCFADWCLGQPKHQQLKPDRPYSLFEGLAGVAYFLTDIQDPSQAGFPAYNLQL